MKLLIEGHVTQADKQRDDYVYIPFELTQPASRLTVRYSYSARISSDKREGGNVIDIGLFDPRGTDFPGAAGFRGWTGSARQEFTITPAEATPGYLPGPLPAGRYQIILGLYRIWSRGADYRVEIEADLGAPEIAFPETPSEFLPDPGASADEEARLWLRGDLQSHTYHSDGRGSPAQLVAKALALDLDFLAITDHNNVSNHRFLPALAGGDALAGSGRGLLLIPGQEVTTFYGHMNVWGTSRWCDFRSRSDEAMSAIIRLAHESGGVCSINHPKENGPPWEYDLSLPVDAMEVWQGPWPWRNEQSLALWDRLLVSGRRLPAVGGSDYHCPAGEDTNLLRLGQPTTWVKVAERGVPAVLAAIRAGRVSISAEPRGPRLDLHASCDGAVAGMGEELELPAGFLAEFEVQVDRGAGWTLRLVADGKLAYETAITTDSARVRARANASTYLRAELVGDAPVDLIPENAPIEIDVHNWRWALSNPIYIRPQRIQESVVPEA